MPPAHVVEILVRPYKGATLQDLTEVRAIPGEGLIGDWGENITLIESEKIDAFAEEYELLFSAYDARRNIVTCGIELNPLLGREFLIGPVRVRATMLCQPCVRLADKTHRQVLTGLLHRGGLRCEILSEGTIHVGDPLRVPSLEG